VLNEMKRICEVPDVLFIVDAVMTGWGRTGTSFACEQADVSPDSFGVLHITASA
jgi:adenosylmethionine---8-amino-7-oxononanoate aminotransferase